MNPNDKKPLTHKTVIQVRFADTDAIGHINNASFALYAETARLHFMKDLKEDVRSIILAHVDIDYRRQVLFEEEIVIETWVERIGNSSFTLRHNAWANRELAAEMRSVIVQFDYKEQRSIPLPASLRASLEPYFHGPAPDAPAAV